MIDSCKQCAPGSYNENFGAAVCTLCPAGYASPVIGSFHYKDCTICPAGTYSDPGAGECSLCEPGSWNSEEGAHYCNLCPAGTASEPLGAESEATCSICPEGQWSSEGEADCSDCEPGTYNPVQGSAGCTPCNAGYASSAWGADSEDTCTICLQGTHSFPGSSVCSDCPPNTFNWHEGRDDCEACPPHSTSPAQSIPITSCAWSDVQIVALESVAYPGTFLRAQFSGCDEYYDGGCGEVKLKRYPDHPIDFDSKETWLIWDNDDDDETFSIRSVNYSEIATLRMDYTSCSSSFTPGGCGVVNLQYFDGPVNQPYSDFHIRYEGNSMWAIQSSDWPNGYVRADGADCNGNNSYSCGTVNVQYFEHSWEVSPEELWRISILYDL